MMSASYIAEMSRKAARESCRLGLLPFIVWPEDIVKWKATVAAGRAPRLPFPALGERNPRGFTLVQEFFVDSSGWGGHAMSMEKLLDKLQVGLAYSLGDIGQFQAYVREWKPSKSRLDAVDSKRALGGSDEPSGPGEVFSENDHEPVIVIMHKR
jgi:hypothetical protein